MTILADHEKTTIPVTLADMELIRYAVEKIITSDAYLSATEVMEYAHLHDRYFEEIEDANKSEVFGEKEGPIDYDRKKAEIWGNTGLLEVIGDGMKGAIPYENSATHKAVRIPGEGYELFRIQLPAGSKPDEKIAEIYDRDIPAGKSLLVLERSWETNPKNWVFLSGKGVPK